ncbi:unnamed protein product [Ilex paraguariensis]|uniref:Uncharacterized protein n=1 Tax=Ilex paraguariensis TaxID=185542 RepID=A0ABC8URL6_9AQUA
MSYIKVSKEQHQLIKSSMKHSNNSILPRPLNNVLGNLNSYHVQPFASNFIICLSRLQVAIRDLPATFANWRRRQLEKWELTKSLEQEMKDKLKSLKEDSEEENCQDMFSEVKDDGAAEPEPTLTSVDEIKEKSDSLLWEQKDNGVALEDEEKENPDFILQEQMDDEATNFEYTMADNNESVSACTRNQDLLQISSFCGSHELHSIDLDSVDSHVMTKIDDISPRVSGYSDNFNHVDVPFSRGNAVSSAGDAWPTVSVPGSYYHSISVNHDYASAHDLSLGHPEDSDKQPTHQLIDLECNLRDEDPGRNFLHRQSNGVETSQFPGHFREQLCSPLPLELGQKRLNDLYLLRNTQQNMYPGRNRYSIPREEHFLPIKIPDLAVNNTRMSAPPQSHLNGGELLRRDWFSDERRAHSGWSGAEGAVIPNSFGNGSNVDQSLFSVLSECSKLRSGAPYNPMCTTEQFTQSRNYDGLGGGIHTTSNMLPQIANPFNHLSGHEAAAGLKNNNMEWMSLPFQESVVQDSICNHS